MYEDIVYRRLAQLRTQKGVSAREMSLDIGQSDNYINMIENQRNFPSMAGFFYICEYLGIHPKDFFDEGMGNPQQLHSLVEKWNRLNPEQAEHLFAIIDDLSTR